MKRLTLAALALAIVLLSNVVKASDFDDRLSALKKVKRKDIIMHRMEIAVDALKTQNHQIASEQLDIVLADIESFYTDTEAAKKARSIWVNEGRKHFKGEPYERAMAYYYRGLAYLIEGDYDNAHASFKGGQLQDAMAEGHEQRTDFVLLMTMQAWAAKLMGQEELALRSEKDIALYRPGFEVPSPDTHMMVVVETGFAPRKIRDGVAGERLVFRRGKKIIDRYAAVGFGGDEIELRPMEDIYYQASTRGARVIDFLNRGKAVFKQQWGDSGSSIANIATTSGLFLRSINDYKVLEGQVSGVQVHGQVAGKHIRTLDQLALAAAAISLLSSKVKAKADIRSWHNLPDQVHIGFVPKNAIGDAFELPVALLDELRREIEIKSAPLLSSGDGEKIAWLKVH